MISNQTLRILRIFLNQGYIYYIFPFRIKLKPFPQVELEEYGQRLPCLLLNLLSIPGQVIFLAGLGYELYHDHTSPKISGLRILLAAPMLHVLCTHLQWLTHTQNYVDLTNIVFRLNVYQGMPVT